jgi:hypothetical protein
MSGCFRRRSRLSRVREMTGLSSRSATPCRGMPRASATRSPWKRRARPPWCPRPGHWGCGRLSGSRRPRRAGSSRRGRPTPAEGVPSSPRGVRQPRGSPAPRAHAMSRARSSPNWAATALKLERAEGHAGVGASVGMAATLLRPRHVISACSISATGRRRPIRAGTLVSAATTTTVPSTAAAIQSTGGRPVR